MRSRSLLIATLALPLTAWAAEPKPDEMVNNPPFASWSSFKPGTVVSQKETVTLADGSKLTFQKTFKLVEKTKDKVVVESVIKESDGGGVESATTMMVFPAKVKRSEVDSPSEVASVAEGKEQVDFKGKRIDTEWVEATIMAGDEVTTDKVWTAKEVPGGIVKQTLTRKKGDKVVSESLLDVVEYK
jgi:hypothetical protein